MFAFIYLVQEEGWRLEGDTIAIYTNFFSEQREQVGIILLSDRIVKITYARRLDVEDLIEGIRNIGYQIKLGDAIPLIKDLEIGSIFKGEDNKEGDSVTDLVLLVLRILRRDLSELAGSIEPVDLYNEGQLSYVISLVRTGLGT